MHEKTLLYGALAATAIGCAIGIWRANARPTHASITDVTLVDQKLADGAPIQLTASDGSGLALVSLTAKAVATDPLALTELHLVFANPEPRVREGTFRITLPQGASLSRFAMKVGDAWQEGEVVEKQQARQAYEDFLHRRQDPALMEQGGGNEFTARVFPIPANGTKELVVTYAEVLGEQSPYTLPLRGLPALGVLDVDVQASGGGKSTSFGIHRRAFTPGEDFVVAAKELPRSSGLRSGELVVARVVPFATTRPDPVGSAIVLVDTSASRALGLGDEAELVRGVLAKLGDAPVVVAAFDQQVDVLWEGASRGFGANDAQRIVERGAFGASDLARALAWAEKEAGKRKAKRVVLVTDGVATAGETDAQKLKAQVDGLRAAGIERLDAIAAGGIRDDATLRVLARGVLVKDGVVLDAKLGADTIARRLGEATSSGVPVKVDGATWSWPASLDGLQAGDDVVVFARLKEGAAASIAIGEQRIAPDLRSVERPLLERAVAQAEIQSLVEAPTKDPAATKNEIVALSVKNRVLSPHTAMLVLETDADYARFKIDRNARVDILAVENGRVAVVQGDRHEKQPPPSVVEKTADFAEAPRAGGAGGARARAAAPAPAQAGDLRLGSGGGGASPSPAEPPPPPGAAPPPLPAAGAGLAGLGGGADLHVGSGGPIAGGRGGGLAGLQALGEGMPAQERKVTGPIGEAAVGATTTTVPIANADRVVAGLRPRFRQCYQQGLSQDPSQTGRLVVMGVVATSGEVSSSAVVSNSGMSPAVANCIARVLQRAQFDSPSSESRIQIPIAFRMQGSQQPVPQPWQPPTPMPTAPPPLPTFQFAPPQKPPAAKPYEGPLAGIMESLARGDKASARRDATAWQQRASGDVLALVGLGEALEASADKAQAARVYGSIVDLFAFRADSRRFAGERLERLADPFALELAADTYAKAAEQRPDHPASHRLYAYALLKSGQPEKAFQAIVAGSKRSYPSGRFAGADRILREDVGLIAAAWARAEPARAAEIAKLRAEAGGTEENQPSIRFVLVWETDANDVDFHIYDGKGGHAYYAARQLQSGGELYADVTTGYGPECFTIRGPREARAYPYTLQANYYSRGPMGYGMGKLEILDHDGKGGITFDERPYVVMIDHAFVDLGSVDRPKQ